MVLVIEMNEYQCQNCKNEFESEDASRCPRCSSQKIILKKIKDKTIKPNIPQEGTPTGGERKPFHYTTGSMTFGDTKEAWIKSQQQKDAKACPKCGNTHFEIDRKLKEKVCTKCGEILYFSRQR